MFFYAFPTVPFSEWNQDIDDATAQDFINHVGKASRIDIKQFIEDLWAIRH